jgi:hypothetical protein
MNDKQFDDLVSMVFSDMDTKIPDSFMSSIADAQSPLALLINELLRCQPGIRFYDQLHDIALLNQGRLEDLNAPAFRSYVIRKTQLSEDMLRKCVDELQTFWRLRGLAERFDSPILMAARDDEGSGGDPITIEDLLGQLNKRSQ